MGLKKDPSEKIRQVSVGITRRQEDFLNEHSEIDLNTITRRTIDEQIKLLNDPKFLKEEQ